MSTHTTTNPTTETPSSSETSENPFYPEEYVSAADVSTKDSKVRMTSNQSGSTTSNQPGSAEAAAEKLYEERIEEEYAKREGAAVALYRALLLSTRALAPDIFPPPQRTSLQNIIRNRFKQARHEQSPRYLRLCFEAGYEALDRLDAAGAGVAGDTGVKEGGSAAYILDLLARAPEKVKRAPPITALDPSLLKDLKLHLRTRPNATATTEAEKPSLFDRPLPLAQLKGGKRRVPVLYNAQGVPVLRLSKPQPAALSGYINHRAEVKQKRHDTRHRLTEELEGARWEDGWDGIVERETGVREGDEEGGRGKGSRWTQEISSAREEVGRKLSEDAERRRVIGQKMQGVVDRETALAGQEARDEAQRALWEASMGNA